MQYDTFSQKSEDLLWNSRGLYGCIKHSLDVPLELDIKDSTTTAHLANKRLCLSEMHKGGIKTRGYMYPSTGKGLCIQRENDWTRTSECDCKSKRGKCVMLFPLERYVYFLFVVPQNNPCCTVTGWAKREAVSHFDGFLKWILVPRHLQFCDF